MTLFHRYGIGQKEYMAGKYEKAQELLLAAYNAGPTFIRKNTEKARWPKETKDYSEKILTYKEKISEQLSKGLDREDIINEFKGIG
jgi:soluble lytic murein transglycosylase-like protein